MDIAQRFSQNPILRPRDLNPGIEGMEIVCLLNPGVFKFDGKIWLLLRVAERPKQKVGKISFPVYNDKDQIEIMNFDIADPDLDASDPRVINYKNEDYLTTMTNGSPVVDSVEAAKDLSISSTCSGPGKTSSKQRSR
jgi:predicted GH43/DUF377 family glycosyl hydrolase